MFPPKSLDIFFQIHSPSPTPFGFKCFVSSNFTNYLPNFSIFSYENFESVKLPINNDTNDIAFAMLFFTGWENAAFPRITLAMFRNYKSDTIHRAINEPGGEEKVKLRKDDYALMIHYFSKTRLEDWKNRKKQLNEIIGQNNAYHREGKQA